MKAQTHGGRAGTFKRPRGLRVSGFAFGPRARGRRYWLCGTDTVTVCVVTLPAASAALMVMV